MQTKSLLSPDRFPSYIPGYFSCCALFRQWESIGQSIGIGYCNNFEKCIVIGIVNFATNIGIGIANSFTEYC